MEVQNHSFQFALFPLYREPTILLTWQYQRYMATTFLKSFEDEPSENKLRLHVADACIQRSLRILGSGRWPNVDFARKRYQTEYNELKLFQSQILELGGAAYEFFSCLSSTGDAISPSLNLFKWSDLLWINEECRRAAGNKDVEEEQPKSVREL
jgi:hypothetical protein